jgi:hypothetical protein
MQSLSLQPAIPLCLVLGFARRYRLPLHVAGRVRSAAFERLDMIDDIDGAPPARPASGRARMLPLEGVLGGGCSSYRLWGVDVSVRVAQHTAGLTRTNQRQRPSTLHPHHGAPIDLAC